ncbi:MAG: universal stress protein [Candidatus Melainabacteria bacterium]|nr:universal stress protein [Candidatus Melainabacteria bacterium]
MAANIAVGLDGSDSSWEAFRQSLEMAKYQAATLHLVSVQEEQEPSYSASELIKAEHDRRENLLKIQTEAKVLAKAEKIEVHAVILHGKPIEKIVGYVKENNIQLLVMGYKGHSSLIDAMLGNQVEKLIRYAPCTVMVVRGKTEA